MYNGELRARPVTMKRIHQLLQRDVGEEVRWMLFGYFWKECKKLKLQTLNHLHDVGKCKHNTAR